MKKIPQPSFVQPEYLKALLAWPRRHERLFVEGLTKQKSAQAQTLFTQGRDFYEAVFELITEVGGFMLFDKTLKSFDNDFARRGIIGKIRGKIQALGDVPRSSSKNLCLFYSENIENIASKGHHEMAAEYIWSMLSMSVGVSKGNWGEPFTDILVTANLQPDPVREALGEFLTYLNSDFEYEDGDFVDTEDTALPMDISILPASVFNATDRWHASIENLRVLIGSATFPSADLADQICKAALSLVEAANEHQTENESERDHELEVALSERDVLISRSDQVLACKLSGSEFTECLRWSDAQLASLSRERLSDFSACLQALNANLAAAEVSYFSRKEALALVESDQPDAMAHLSAADDRWRVAKQDFELSVQKLGNFEFENDEQRNVQASVFAVKAAEIVVVEEQSAGEPDVSTEEPEFGPLDSSAEDQTDSGQGEKAEELDAEIYDRPLTNAADRELDEIRRVAEQKIRDLLEAGHFPLAHEVSRACAVIVPNQIFLTPAIVLEALAVGDAVRGVSALAASNAFDHLQEPLFEALQTDAETEEAAATQLIGFAAALRPTLFSPHGSAGAIVGWGGWHDALYDLGQFAADITTRLGRPLTFADLAPWRNKQNRLEEAASATAALLKWATTAPKQTLKFARATQIWSDLFKTGPLATAIEAIRTENRKAPDFAASASNWLAEDDLLRRLDDEHRLSKDKPLEAGSRTRLLSKIADAAGQLKLWAEAQLGTSDTERNQHFATQTDELRRHLESAGQRIRAARSSNDNIQTALNVVGVTIDDLLKSFDGVGPDAPLTLEQRTKDDLLLVPALNYRYGQPVQWTQDTANAFVHNLDPSSVPDYSAAFSDLIFGNRFEAAGHILRRLSAYGTDIEEQAFQLSHAYEIALAEAFQRFERLRREVDVLLGADTRNEIDQSISNRLDAVQGDLDAISADTAPPRDLPDLLTQLTLLQDEVAIAFEILIEPMRSEIARLEAENQDVSELKGMADRSDLATLAEHLEAAQSGHTPAGNLFSGGVLSQYVATMWNSAGSSDFTLTEFKRALEQTDGYGPLNFTGMDQEERVGARRLLSAWIGLRSDMFEDNSGDAARRAAIIHLFQEFGFANVRISQASTTGPAKTFAILTEALENRTFCSIPSFGSEAKGNYNLVVIDPKRMPQGEDLFGVFQKASVPGSANILIVLGNLTQARRNQFLQAARKESKGLACALLDESVVVFLAGRSGRRLSDFFDLTIPQGTAQPYSDKAAQTSVEMFFGRRQELNQLLDPNGSCLVYGGRQLGKTALLKQLILQHHRPPHQFVLYDAFDDYGDGARYPTEEIWKRIGELMVEAEIVPTKPNGRLQVEEAMVNFLAKHPTSRIIVLMDEADKFLKSEIQNGYKNILPIKARLMEPTNYRCKFVFAGLHDVQRSARSPNSPLLHFGKAIQVGPLYQSDIPSAWEMVERPLRSIGYFFPDRSLIGRVLSQVGYYPSFVQSFCKSLIERLDRRIGRTGAKQLPLAITSDDIDDATRDETFRRGLQDKFEATLNLDERYRLITYAVLVAGFRKQELGLLNSGYSDVEIQKLALDWWPDGFSEDQSLDAFQGLLEEMTGLGVLVRQLNGNYMIRSARIAAMLGGSEQISQKIIELVEQPHTPPLDAGHIRRLSADDDRVSPMTERQEGMLLSNTNPIHVGVGTTALGIDWLAPNLERLSEYLPESEKFQVFRKIYSNSRDILKVVEAAGADAQRGFTKKNRAWVVATGPWPDAELLQKLAEHPLITLARRGRPNSVRIILVPNSIDWRNDTAAIGDGSLHGAAVLPLMPLGEGGLRQWAASMTAPNSKITGQHAEALKKFTGGFAKYLWNVKRATKPAELIDSASKLFEKRILDKLTLAEIGIDDADLLRVVEETLRLGGIDPELLDEIGMENGETILTHLQRIGILETVRSKSGLVELAVNPFVGALVKALRSDRP